MEARYEPHLPGAQIQYPDAAFTPARKYEIQSFCSSLKQWRMLHALIDCGSYAEAAARLHVSQSTLSYTLLKLQERLGVQLLKLEGRRAVLTPPGKLLVERSRRVLDEARALEEFARALGR